MQDDYIHSAGVGKRILCLSDFHVPFNLPVSAFQNYASMTDILVLNGDIEDCQSISKFNKRYRVNFADEMVATREFLIQLIRLIKPKEVYITKGNHEVRLGRFLSESINDDLFQLMPDTPLDLIINDGFKNRDRYMETETWYAPLVEVFKNIPIHYDNNWWCKVGKTIFCHPMAYSSSIMKTADKAADFFVTIDRDFDTIVMAHTHKMGAYVTGNIHLYEQGCCCDTNKLNYNDGRLVNPAKNGQIYICQDIDGHLLPNRTRLVEL